MRLDEIVEALDPVSKWNKVFTKLVANPPKEYRGDYIADTPEQEAQQAREEEERKKEWARQREGWRLLRKAIKFHAETFNGKRWPELEQVLSIDGWTDNPTLVGYLNQITEDWPEGEYMLVQAPSRVFGSNEATIDYLLKKNLKSPHLHDYYRGMLGARNLRAHLNDRMSRFRSDQERLKTQLAQLPPPPPDPTGLDDKDEFYSGYQIRLTLKQLENRIKTIEQTLALSDAELVELVLSKRPKAPAQREALGLPWAPPNLAAYVDKWGIR